ncbi:MAG: NigD-like C-terminal domain-containing protein [Draconibacterium sp.]|nr:NigD-like C-terminal domain-containing protein [Draconibacterium sp.]
MKKIFFVLVVGILFFITACNDEDGYSLNTQWIGFGILQENGSPRIVMDNGDLLIPVSYAHNHLDLDQIITDNHEKLEDGERVLVNYTVLDDEQNNDGEITLYYVKINSIRKILLKDIMDITTENADSVGNDPIIVKDVWMSSGMLNFKIKYWGFDQMHYINLVKDPGIPTEDKQPIALELRHNANGDSENIPYVAYVSFKLGEIEISGLDSVEFVVTATDYDGEGFEYEGVYSYGEDN